MRFLAIVLMSIVAWAVSAQGPQLRIENDALKLRFSHPATVDLSGAIFLANESITPTERYPVDLRGRADVTVLGGTVIGMQSRTLTWREMKSRYDGDGIRVVSKSGAVVDGIYIQNVEDGFSPRGSGDWILQNSWLRYIRDDAIENDALLSGEIRNCLIDGTFMFLSNRPGRTGRDVPPQKVTPVVVIDSCLVHVQLMPDDTPKTRFSKNGKACGQLFKWSRDAGQVRVRNTTFLVDYIASRGKTPMGFPAGEYSNVTLIWPGPGEYPAELPEGVTVTKDVAKWKRQRTKWILANSWRFPHRNIVKDIE